MLGLPAAGAPVKLFRRCRERYSYLNPDFRCWRRTITGLCLDHRLERVRFERIVGSFRIELILGNLPRPRIIIDDERPIKWVAFDIGDGSSDPVFSIAWNRSRRTR